ncbi:MAG: hypothetical protein ACE364_08255 [Chlorobiota bacterium]
MSSYPEIKVPKHIVQDNSKMSLEDVRNYFDWFIAIKEERLRIFYEQVFKSDQVELSVDKLQTIYYFFKKNIATREQTPEEIEAERAKLPKHIQKIHEIPDYEFIEPTITLMIDAGIYYGELLIKEIEGLRWEIEKDPKMAHYGRPILIKEEIRKDVNPVAVFYVMALRVQKGNIKEDFLLEAHNHTKNSFLGKQKDFFAMVEKWSKKK